MSASHGSPQRAADRKPLDGTTSDEKRLQIAIETRAFEIELFWKRSIFFWGFISVALVGYATLRSTSSDLALVISCFGMVCSAAWTLLNRGSKYWQENWETKVHDEEWNVLGSPLFGEQEDVQRKGFGWLQARKYSVSKLLIALSDYVLFMWLGLTVWRTVRLFQQFEGSFREIALSAFAIGSFLYVALLVLVGRTSKDQEAQDG
jgi:hypothetical protein